MIAGREIHRALRKLQIKTRRVRKGAEIPVAVAEAHALVELHAAGELSVNELAHSLLVPQSQASRVLQKLRSRRFIEQREGPTDSRRALSSLSRAGLSVIDRIDEVMGEIYQECADRLSAQEANELALFFERIAERMGCGLIRRRKHENRLRAAHRQMARVFGLLGAHVYSSDLTRSQWAILETLFWAPEPINATIIERHLGIKPAVISEILNRFELQGYLERSRSRENHRINVIVLTTAGRNYFRRLELRDVARLNRALRGTSAGSRKRALELLNRFAGEWGANSIFLDKRFITKEITEPQEKKMARGFTLREIVRLGWEDDAPDPLFARSQRIWGLFDTTTPKPTLQATCVVEEEIRAWVVTVSAWSANIRPQQVHAFIQHAHYLSHTRGVVSPLVIQFERLQKLFLGTKHRAVDSYSAPGR